MNPEHRLFTASIISSLRRAGIPADVGQPVEGGRDSIVAGGHHVREDGERDNFSGVFAIDVIEHTDGFISFQLRRWDREARVFWGEHSNKSPVRERTPAQAVSSAALIIRRWLLA